MAGNTVLVDRLYREKFSLSVCVYVCNFQAWSIKSSIWFSTFSSPIFQGMATPRATLEAVLFGRWQSLCLSGSLHDYMEWSSLLATAGFYVSEK